MYLLKRFRCYLEGTSFDVITDNQVLHNFFTKKDLSRREAIWIDFLSSFGINKMTHKAGRLHVLGDALSRISAPTPARISNLEVLTIELPNDLIDNYPLEPAFGPVLKALKGKWPDCKFQRNRINRSLPSFRLTIDCLYYV